MEEQRGGMVVKKGKFMTLAYAEWHEVNDKEVLIVCWKDSSNIMCIKCQKIENDGI